MNRKIPDYLPPSRDIARAPSFPEYLKQLEEWQKRFFKYNQDYMNQYAVPLLNTGAQGFPTTNVASAGTIDITAYLTLITGTVTVSTIRTTPDFSGQICLIAQDGFATDTAGNINKVITIAAGDSALFDFYPPTAKWYAHTP